MIEINTLIDLKENYLGLTEDEVKFNQALIFNIWASVNLPVDIILEKGL